MRFVAKLNGDMSRLLRSRYRCSVASSLRKVGVSLSLSWFMIVCRMAGLSSNHPSAFNSVTQRMLSGVPDTEFKFFLHHIIFVFPCFQLWFSIEGLSPSLPIFLSYHWDLHWKRESFQLTLDFHLLKGKLNVSGANKSIFHSGHLPCQWVCWASIY